jgi:transcription elongation factor GreA
MESSSELQSEPRESDSSPLADLRAALSTGEIDRFEELWVEVLGSSGTERFDELVALGGELWEQAQATGRHRASAGTVLELLLGVATESTSPAAVLQLYWMLVDLFPSKRDYLTGFAERFEAVYPVISPERAFYEVCGFPSCGDPAGSLRRLGNLLHFQEGAYCFHGSGWGVGRVVSVDPFLKQVRVDLEHKQGHRIAIDAIDSILQPLASESFVVLKHQKSEKLDKMRDEDPIRLVTLVLEGFGNPLVAKEIKEQLVPVVLAPAAWAKWWTKTKAILRKTGFFRVGDRSPYLVERVEAEISYADELLSQFQVNDWRVARKIARQVARESTAELEPAWSGVHAGLLQRCESSDPAVALEAAVIAARGSADDEALKAVVLRFSLAEIEAALQPIAASDEQRRIVAATIACREDWTDLLKLMVRGRADAPRSLALVVLQEKVPELALTVVGDLRRAPQTSPEGFCYCIRERLKGKSGDRACLKAFHEASEGELVGVCMDLLDNLYHRSQREGPVPLKDVLGRAFAVMTFDNYQFFSRGVAAMPRRRRRDVHARIVDSKIFPPDVHAGLLVALARVDPDLDTQQKAQFWEDEESIYVTADGLRRREGEFRELTEVKLPANFEQIGRAREFGDLSENAEYTAALEERDQLTKRATEIQAELEIAKTLEPSMVDPARVSLGTRVRLERLTTGEEVEYAVLGPWDGSPEEGVVNYRSPLARAIMGHESGEELEVQLPGGVDQYRILSITSYFE